MPTRSFQRSFLVHNQTKKIKQSIHAFIHSNASINVNVPRISVLISHFLFHFSISKYLNSRSPLFRISQLTYRELDGRESFTDKNNAKVSLQEYGLYVLIVGKFYK